MGSGLAVPKEHPRLRAVIFDVDGTLAETERAGHRVAFNRSFEHLGLPDRWDEALYGELVQVAGTKERLRHYFERYRLLPAPERDRLVAALHRAKNGEFRRLLDEIDFRPRSGVLRLIDELHGAGLMTAVATSGSPECIVPLLRKLLGPARLARFRAVVTGDGVARKKPAPEIYRLTLLTLGVAPEEALAVEDSRNGLDAATTAGLSCLVVRSWYSRDDDGPADLVVDEFGEPARPCRVLRNPHGIEVDGMIDLEILRRLHRVAHAAAGLRRAEPGAASPVEASPRGAIPGARRPSRLARPGAREADR